MKGKINLYFSLLLVTIAGAGATLLIVHIVYANTFDTTMSGSEANYASLQQSILR
jgi:hypothetical protein